MRHCGHFDPIRLTVALLKGIIRCPTDVRGFSKEQSSAELDPYPLDPYGGRLHRTDNGPI